MVPSPAKLLFRPLLWLLWLVLLAVLLPLLLTAVTPFALLFWGGALVAVTVSKDFRQLIGLTPLGLAVWLPLWPLLILSMAAPAVAAAHAAVLWLDAQSPSQLPAALDAVLRWLPTDAREFIANHPFSRQDWAGFCIVAGVTGVSSNLVYAFLDVPWRIKQIRQIRAIPRSKARSAAVGLAEFEGVVRTTTPGAVVSSLMEDNLPPFRLEDETGRILVDPRGARVRPRNASGHALSLSEVEEGLRDGDRAYVIGHVQPIEGGAPGAEALVVKPLGRTLVASPVARLLFPKGDGVADRDTPNIFIVDRGGERDVIARLRLALWDFCGTGAIYAASSLWLVQAAWGWLR